MRFTVEPGGVDGEAVGDGEIGPEGATAGQLAEDLIEGQISDGHETTSRDAH